MRTFWRNSSTPIGSHAEWLVRIAKRHRRPGTSAPSLATAWAGPVEMMGALRRQPVFAGLLLEQIVIEAQSAFDEHGGGIRNHDLVVHGRLPDGEKVIVGVEAKAGESLDRNGRAVRRRSTGQAGRRQANQCSRTPRGLARALRATHDPCAARVLAMRYQLLSGLAGTEAEAARTGAQHAVLMIHDFITDERSQDETALHGADLRRFCTTVFDSKLPSPQEVPWCFAVPSPATMPSNLYLAWAITDLRSETLPK